MKSSKTTRRALLGSLTSLVLCFAMLIGSTFAWFTDSASTSVNQVKSGTLDVQIIGAADDAEVTELKFQNQSGSDAILWEPGVTFRTQGFRIKSAGDLALKYKIALNGLTGDSKLLEVIDFSVVKANGNDYDAVALDSFEGHLSANTTATDVLYLQGKMQTTAGNEYQTKTLTGLSITVYATQDTVEYDSTGNQYDAGAMLPTAVTNQADVTAKLTDSNATTVNLALAAGTYTLPTTSNKTVTISGTEATVIDMTNSTAIGTQNANLDITFDGVTVEFEDTFDYKGITHAASVTYKDCVIKGNQVMYANNVEFINCTFINSSDYCVWTYGAGEVTFENCTFETAGKAILVYAEQWVDSQVVNVTNCTFDASSKGYTSQGDNCAAIEIDSSLITGSYTVNISGTNYLNRNFNGISRIKAQKEPSNTTVNDTSTVESFTALVSTAAELKTALDNSTNDVTVYAILTKDIDMSDWTALNGGSNHADIVLLGNGHALKNQTHPLFSAFPGKNFTVSDVTVSGANINYSSEDSEAGAFIGEMRCNGGGTYSFTNCHVKNSSIKAHKYAGAFVGYASDGAEGINFTNCTVTNTSVETADSSAGGFIGHTISKTTLTNCTIGGNSNVKCAEDRNGSAAKAGWFVGTVNGGTTTLTGCTNSSTGTLGNTNAQAPLNNGFVGRTAASGNVTVN